MSHHAVKQKVLQCDDELSEQALGQLLKYLPGPEAVRGRLLLLRVCVCVNLLCDVCRW